VLIRCNQKSNPTLKQVAKEKIKQTQIIKPPLKNKDVAYSKFKIIAEKGGELHLKTGSHVVIPKNSIIDKDGNPVNGEIDLVFREFHNTQEIFLSGIPMQFSKSNNYLESMGMAELKGTKDNKEVYLKPNSGAFIDLATKSTPVKEYALWQLDKNVEWTDAGYYTTIPNSRKENSLKIIDKEKRKRKKTAKSPDVFFEIYSDLEDFPNMEAWQGVTWELLKGKIPEDFERIDWNTIKLKKLSNKKYKINLAKQASYYYDGEVIEKKIEMLACPILSKKELKKKEKEYAVLNKKYKEYLKKAELEVERLNQEAKLLNRFKINGFGIYNVDVLKSTEMFATLDLDFDFEKESLKKINNITLYMLLPEKNTVLNFQSDNWDNIPFTNSKTNLAAVLPGGDIALVDYNDFNAKVNSKNVNSGFQNKFYFTTKRISQDEFSGLLNNSLN